MDRTDGFETGVRRRLVGTAAPFRNRAAPENYTEAATLNESSRIAGETQSWVMDIAQEAKA